MGYRLFASRILLNALILVSIASVSWGASDAPRSAGSASAPRAEPKARTPEQQAVAEREQTVRHQLSDTTDGETRFELLNALSSDYFRVGMVVESMRVREEIVVDQRIPPGRRSLAASALANAYGRSLDFARSQRLLERAKSLARDTTPAELELLPREPSYAYYTAEAEIDRRYLNRHNQALMKLRDGADIAWRNFNDPALSPRRHRAAANELLENSTNLIRLMVQNNRRAEALSYANEMSWYADNRQDLQPSPAQRAGLKVGRAIALSSNDDYEGALAAIDSAIDGFRRADVAPHATNFADALRLRLMIALALGRIGEYQADADAYERAAGTNPVVASEVSEDERQSLVFASRGQWQEAQIRISASMAVNLRRQGPESPFYKYKAAMHMLYRLQDPDGHIGNMEISSYVTPLIGTVGEWNDSNTRGAYAEDGALAMSMSRAISDGEQGQVLAFRIAELFHMNATQGAMADGAARLAASTPALRALVEQEQTLRYNQNTARMDIARAARRLETEEGKAARQDKQDQTKQDQAKLDIKQGEQAIQAIEDKLADLRAQIASQFPVYRQLVAPAIPTPATLGAALHDGEVYLDVYAGRDVSYAFVVRPGGAFRAVRLSTTRAAITKQVVALRSGFDAGKPPRRAGDMAGFDLGAAANLYEALIAPVQDDLRGAKTVYIGTSGILASIPFNVLAIRPASTLASTKWWIETATPVRIPNASALVLARGHPATRAREPFVAFANPSFDGRVAPSNVDVPVGKVVARAVPADDRAREFDYRRVSPLPETLGEARAIAKTLDAPEQTVLWGTAASRSEAMKRDLSNYRVVLFATHGIVAGEVPGWRKAGLALAYEGSGLADSILTADDIVTLRLNADWVVLSACNTGLVSGNAGDAISALSRAFFAAGARSMLVTQWAVESRSAAVVTTSAFHVYAAEPSLSKADALARAQRDMAMGKNGELYRHPYFWGAYFLAGDAAH
nr:CHAT domain-containing protein [uncultured Cupriavidus sp.]